MSEAERAKVIAELQPGEAAMTLPGHHSGALAVITHPLRPPQLLFEDGSRIDVVTERDYLVEVPRQWREPLVDLPKPPDVDPDEARRFTSSDVRRGWEMLKLRPSQEWTDRINAPMLAALRRLTDAS
jgi:hypothetical protein